MTVGIPPRNDLAVRTDAAGGLIMTAESQLPIDRATAWIEDNAGQRLWTARDTDKTLTVSGRTLRLLLDGAHLERCLEGCTANIWVTTLDLDGEILRVSEVRWKGELEVL